MKHPDSLDLKILTAIEADGRISVSDLARQLGISRAYTSRRLQRLIEQQTTRIVSFTNPAVLGYDTIAIIGLQVLPSQIDAAATRLGELPNIYLVLTTAGQQDIIIWTMFQSPAQLSGFLGGELATVPGITSTETMVVLEMRKLSFSFVTASQLSNADAEAPASQIRNFATRPAAEADHLDLIMLKELEKNARQPISDLAKKLGTGRAYTSNKLQQLIDKQYTRIVAFTNPFILGYNFFSLIGVKVSPGEINTVAGRLSAYPDIFMVAKTAGRYSIIAWAVFQTPLDLSAFLMNELAKIEGITSTDTIIALELRKMAFMYLASSLPQED